MIKKRMKLRSPQPHKRAVLTPAVIVEAALRVMDREGFTKLTLRKVAAELNIQAPTLYWHFRDKQALLNAMYEHLIALAPPKAYAKEVSWQEILIDTGTSLYTALSQYRDGAQLMVHGELYDGVVLSDIDKRIGYLVRAGLDHRTALLATATITTFTVGFTIEKQPDRQLTPEEMEEGKKRLWNAAENHQLNNLRTAFAQFVDDDSSESNEEFTYGLQLIVGGIAALDRPILRNSKNS